MNGAQTFLLSLGRLGADCIFANPGSEFIPLIEAYPSAREQGPVPRPITVPFEGTAMAMAYGYYLATGRPQAVMVHSTVGTANALIGIISASRMNVPVLFLAGRTPVTEADTAGCRDRFIHWAQESFDQGALTREYVRWDYEIRRADMIDPALTRAWTLMTAQPPLPVSLTIAREIFLQPSSPAAATDTPISVTEPSATEPNAQDLHQLQRWLDTSKSAVLITARSGYDSRTVQLLENASAKLGLGVVCPQAQAMNLSTEHANFLGFDHNVAIENADLIVVLDTDVPWLPTHKTPKSKARIVHVGPDPLFQRLPMRSFASHLNIPCATGSFIKALNEFPPSENFESRHSWLLSQRARFLADREKRVAQAQRSQTITSDMIALTISGLLTSEVVLINELSLAPECLHLNYAGRYFRSGSASGLGWALGCAIGMKMANPGLIPVCVVGDGVYYLSNPLAAHWTAISQKAPLLTVIMNNEGMKSIHKDKTFTDLSPTLNFATIAESCGMFARQVDRPEHLKEALQQGISAVKHGKSAVVDIRM